MDGFSAAKLRQYYLSNPLERGDRYFKLLLSQTDAESLKAIVRNSEQPREHSLRVTQNFALFTDLVAQHKADLAPICRGLAKLVIVDIALSRDQDNPQLIFESMNSTGKALSQSDLIRNYILMGLEPGLQTRLYEDYWRPMELDFGQEAYDREFDSFMRYYLTVRTGEIPRESEVYEAFKEYSRTASVQNAGIEALVKDVRAFARYFCALALGQEKDADLGMAAGARARLAERAGALATHPRLKVKLMVPLADLIDPKNLCRDIVGKRRYDEVEVGLDSLDELPYVMGLVRQSFERQMGEGT